MVSILRTQAGVPCRVRNMPVFKADRRAGGQFTWPVRGSEQVLRSTGQDVKGENAAPSSSAKNAPADEPLWVKSEKIRNEMGKEKATLPWPLYLLLSSFVLIAAVGSIFEYSDRHALFGVLSPDNPLWAPLLLTMAVTGWPTAGFLFLKGVDGFNAAADLQDRLDGYKE